MRQPGSPATHRAGWTLTLAGLLFIAWMTLIPAPEQAQLVRQTPVWCLVCGDLGLVDVLLNILLFVPYGLGLGLARVRRRRAIAAIIVTTCCIELLQMKVIAGRDASLSDVITNTMGGLLGLVLAARWRGLVLPPRRRSGLLAVGAASLWIAIQLFSAWALHPDLPRSAWYGQHAPTLGQFDQFRGRVLSATLAGHRLGNDRLRNTPEVRAALLRGTPLEVVAVTGEAPTRLAPIFSIFDDRQREIVLLGQTGDELAFHLRTRLAALRLRGPSLAAEHAVPRTGGDTLRVSGRFERGVMSLDWSLNGGPARHESLRLSPSWGWSFVLPYDHAFGPWTPFLTMLWVGGLLLPVGYWAGRAGWGRRALPAGVLLLGLGLAAAPWAVGIPLAAGTEWAAGAAGIVAGGVLGRLSRKD